MKSYFENKKFASSSKFWWVLLLLGFLTVAVGLLMFIFPTQSYIAMAMMFGVVIFVSGAITLSFLGYADGVVGRGWIIASGIIEIILGLILMFNTTLSEATMPYYLAFWLIFRSYNQIGFASDIKHRSTFTIITASLLIICALMILFEPYVFGAQAVVIWIALSFILAGISIGAYSLQIKSLADRYRK